MFKKIYLVLEWEVTTNKKVFRKPGSHLAWHFQRALMQSVMLESSLSNRRGSRRAQSRTCYKINLIKIRVFYMQKGTPLLLSRNLCHFRIRKVIRLAFQRWFMEFRFVVLLSLINCESV